MRFIILNERYYYVYQKLEVINVTILSRKMYVIPNVLVLKVAT